MRKTNILGVLASCLLALISAQFAFGQKGNKVEIENHSGELRKICFHRIERNRVGVEKVMAFSLGCYRLQDQQMATWHRTDDKDLQVKVYRPQLIDKLLGSRRMPGSTRSVEIESSGDVSFSDGAAGGTRYILKVCNRRFTQTIQVTLGFAITRIWVTEGWWSVKKGACLEFPVSKMLFLTWGVEYGTVPLIYYYARTIGKDRLSWRGGADGPEGCINETRPFAINQKHPNPAGKMQPYACAGPQERKVKLRNIPFPRSGSRYFYLTF